MERTQFFRTDTGDGRHNITVIYGGGCRWTFPLHYIADVEAFVQFARTMAEELALPGSEGSALDRLLWATDAVKQEVGQLGPVESEAWEQAIKGRVLPVLSAVADTAGRHA